jgi:hypothetical protein
MVASLKRHETTLLATAALTSLAILYYKVHRTFERFVAMQEFIYIPPQRNVINRVRGDKQRGNCDDMHDLSSLGSMYPTELSNGITVQTMGPLGPMHVGGDPNPYASQYLSAIMR